MSLELRADLPYGHRPKSFCHTYSVAADFAKCCTETLGSAYHSSFERHYLGPKKKASLLRRMRKERRMGKMVKGRREEGLAGPRTEIGD